MTSAQNPYAELDDTRYEAVVNGDYTKSSYSSGNGGCLTLSAVGDHIGIQDDKLPEAERKARTHVYTRAELRAFVEGAKAGEFDHLL